MTTVTNAQITVGLRAARRILNNVQFDPGPNDYATMAILAQSLIAYEDALKSNLMYDVADAAMDWYISQTVAVAFPTGSTTI